MFNFFVAFFYSVEFIIMHFLVFLMFCVALNAVFISRLEFAIFLVIVYII